MRRNCSDNRDHLKDSIYASDVPLVSKVDQAELRREFIEREFDVSKYVFELLRTGGFAGKSISVIVPNYNYAIYLRQRLNSIFNQTYPIYEIIVLDDASTDQSIAVLDQVEAETDREIVRLVNSENSGNVFKQWRKGVEAARGDLVWIAEADDDAEPEFVARLVRFFNESPAIVFAFSESSIIDENGLKPSGSYQFYYSGIGERILADEFVVECGRFAAEHLSVRNHILNVSSVLWDRKHLETVLARAAGSAEGFRLAGDWRLYVEACLLGGQIAFTPEPLNVHRRHTGSVTGSTRLLEQVREIKRIHDLVLDCFPGARDREMQMVSYRKELTDRAKKEVGGADVERAE